MLKDKIAYSVYETDNYNLFSYITSNRSIKESHVKDLIKQINDGYELPPIIVKSNGEILDGQHRFEALKRTEQPIQYIIREEIKQDTLQKSNTVVSKWSVNDHINFHSMEGNEDYITLKKFMDYTELGARSAASLLGSVKEYKSPMLGIMNGTFYVTSESDAYTFYDTVVVKIREGVNVKLLNSLRIIYNAGAETNTLVNVVNAMHEELMLINKAAKISERILNMYNKQCDREDKIKFSYNKAGNIMIG